jgi:hypothetical protein
MFSSLSILTVADDGSKQRYINNKNRPCFLHYPFWEVEKVVALENYIVNYSTTSLSQPSTHIRPRAFGPWVNMGVSGWYDI